VLARSQTRTHVDTELEGSFALRSSRSLRRCQQVADGDPRQSPEEASLQLPTLGTPRVAAGANVANHTQAYVDCLRSHGYSPPMDFNPASKVDLEAVPAGATEACQTALGNLLLPPLTPAQKQAYVNYAVCMRQHGLPASDPEFGPGDSVGFTVGKSVPFDRTRYKTAKRACQPLEPGRS